MRDETGNIILEYISKTTLYSFAYRVATKSYDVLYGGEITEIKLSILGKDNAHLYFDDLRRREHLYGCDDTYSAEDIFEKAITMIIKESEKEQ